MVAIWYIILIGAARTKGIRVTSGGDSDKYDNLILEREVSESIGLEPDVSNVSLNKRDTSSSYLCIQ